MDDTAYYDDTLEINSISHSLINCTAFVTDKIRCLSNINTWQWNGPNKPLINHMKTYKHPIATLLKWWHHPFTTFTNVKCTAFANFCSGNNWSKMFWKPLLDIDKRRRCVFYSCLLWRGVDKLRNIVIQVNRNFCNKFNQNRMIWLVNHIDGTNTIREDDAVLQKVTLPHACSKLAQCFWRDGNWKVNEAPGQSEYNNGFR